MVGGRALDGDVFRPHSGNATFIRKFAVCSLCWLAFTYTLFKTVYDYTLLTPSCLVMYERASMFFSMNCTGTQRRKLRFPRMAEWQWFCPKCACSGLRVVGLQHNTACVSHAWDAVVRRTYILWASNQTTTIVGHDFIAPVVTELTWWFRCFFVRYCLQLEHYWACLNCSQQRNW